MTRRTRTALLISAAPPSRSPPPVRRSPPHGTCPRRCPAVRDRDLHSPQLERIHLHRRCPRTGSYMVEDPRRDDRRHDSTWSTPRTPTTRLAGRQNGHTYRVRVAGRRPGVRPARQRLPGVLRTTPPAPTRAGDPVPTHPSRRTVSINGGAPTPTPARSTLTLSASDSSPAASAACRSAPTGRPPRATSSPPRRVPRHLTPTRRSPCRRAPTGPAPCGCSTATGPVLRPTGPRRSPSVAQGQRVRGRRDAIVLDRSQPTPVVTTVSPPRTPASRSRSRPRRRPTRPAASTPGSRRSGTSVTAPPR